MNNFVTQLLRLKIAEKGYKNLLYSPLSIEMLFGLILPGTQGKTREALLHILEISEEEVNTHLKELQTATTSLIQPTDNYHQGEPTYCTFAHSIWHDPLVKVQSRYEHFIKNLYPLDIFPFAESLETTQTKINQWVSQETKEIILELPLSLDTNTVGVLLSALYLKASWSPNFTPQPVGDFHTPDGTTAPTRYMRIAQNSNVTAQAYYLKKEDFRALALLSNDERIGMEIYLPNDAKGLPGFIENLTPALLQQWEEEFEPLPYFNLLMPKFEVEDEFKLSKIADQLGLAALFGLSADLKPLFDTNDLVGFSEIGQPAKIKVHEEGLEAAAVSYGVASRGMPQEHPMVSFEVTHSFFYRIVDWTTGKVLFQGIFTEPTNQ